MSARRRLSRASRLSPLHVGEFPSALVARETLKLWVARAAARGTDRRTLVAIINETNPRAVHVTLGDLRYWRWVASSLKARHAWLERDRHEDTIVVMIGESPAPRECNLGELDLKFPLSAVSEVNCGR
jgi:hypothetical protein